MRRVRNEPRTTRQLGAFAFIPVCPRSLALSLPCRRRLEVDLALLVWCRVGGGVLWLWGGVCVHVGEIVSVTITVNGRWSVRGAAGQSHLNIRPRTGSALRGNHPPVRHWAKEVFTQIRAADARGTRRSGPCRDSPRASRLISRCRHPAAFRADQSRDIGVHLWPKSFAGFGRSMPLGYRADCPLLCAGGGKGIFATDERRWT
jgi:hypothetical protein